MMVVVVILIMILIMIRIIISIVGIAMSLESKTVEFKSEFTDDLKYAVITELDHWTDKPETKAIMDNLIRDTLWEGLPESYTDDSITEYRKEIYEYIYMRYKTAA